MSTPAIDELLQDLKFLHSVIADCQFAGARKRAEEIQRQISAVEKIRIAARQWEAHVKGRASE